MTSFLDRLDPCLELFPERSSSLSSYLSPTTVLPLPPLSAFHTVRKKSPAINPTPYPRAWYRRGLAGVSFLRFCLGSTRFIDITCPAGLSSAECPSVNHLVFANLFTKIARQHALVDFMKRSSKTRVNFRDLMCYRIEHSICQKANK